MSKAYDSLKHPLALQLQNEAGHVFFGDNIRWEPLLIGLFAGLHMLIEDIPGVGKTTLVKVLSRLVGMKFGRIQFTPDMLPGDVTGMTIWDQDKREFRFKPGPILCQFLLADEINRAPARTQAALLESMEEGSVTVDGKTYLLPQPFLVVATQNPLSFAGTFPLPEAQLDRFGIAFSLGYPNRDQGMGILNLTEGPGFSTVGAIKELKPLVSDQELLEMRMQVRQVKAADAVKDYILRILDATRTAEGVRIGAAPRSGQQLLVAAKAAAFLRGRDFVIPEDVIHTAPMVLPHRLLLSGRTKSEDQGALALVKRLLTQVNMPKGV